MYRFGIAVVASVLMVSAAANAQEKAGMAGGAMSKDVVDIAVGSKDHTTLVAAVKAAGLVDTLKGKGPFTVFAPTDAAFAKLPAGTVDTLVKPESKATLTKILTYHVVPGQLSPDQVVGEHETVEGGMVTVTGPVDTLKVQDASVICGGVKTANATVYLIDTVLMPPAA
jgi:uncharacterized surface protein with fasciclin (FAS1) repeats